MLHSKRFSLYRFNHELPPHLPLAVRSTGVYRLVRGSLNEPPMQKWFSEVFWSEEGSGEFIVGKRSITVQEREVFFLLPGEWHDIRPVSARWKYSWFTLDHPQSQQWLEAFGLTKRPLPAREFPTELFRELRRAVFQGTMKGDRDASHCAHALLLAAKEGSLSPLAKSRRRWVEECRQRIDAGYMDPDLNVLTLAEGAQMHRATLFRAFRSAYGMTPSQFLQSRRLHQAMELLKGSDTPIKKVAQQVGMNDANYLARLIHKIAGLSPRQFRANYRQARSEVA